MCGLAVTCFRKRYQCPTHQACNRCVLVLPRWDAPQGFRPSASGSDLLSAAWGLRPRSPSVLGGFSSGGSWYWQDGTSNRNLIVKGSGVWADNQPDGSGYDPWCHEPTCCRAETRSPTCCPILCACMCDSLHLTRCDSHGCCVCLGCFLCTPHSLPCLRLRSENTWFWDGFSVIDDYFNPVVSLYGLCEAERSCSRVAPCGLCALVRPLGR
jgi:hypothetical protein